MRGHKIKFIEHQNLPVLFLSFIGVFGLTTLARAEEVSQELQQKVNEDASKETHQKPPNEEGQSTSRSIRSRRKAEILLELTEARIQLGGTLYKSQDLSIRYSPFIEELSQVSFFTGFTSHAKFKDYVNTKPEIWETGFFEANLGLENESYGFGCDYQRFFGESFYLSGGGVVRYGEVKARRDLQGRSSLGPQGADNPIWKDGERVGNLTRFDFRVAVGNQWELEKYTFGIDWLVLYIPIFHKLHISNNTENRYKAVDVFSETKSGLTEVVPVPIQVKFGFGINGS